MKQQIKTLESIYKEITMMLNTDYPAMIEFKQTISELYQIQENGKVCSQCISREQAEIQNLDSLPNQILNKVAAIFDCTVEDIKGKPRQTEIKWARQLVAFILMKELKLSCTLSGKFINKNHATVLHSCKEIVKLSAKNNKFCELKAQVYEAFGYFTIMNSN